MTLHNADYCAWCAKPDTTGLCDSCHARIQTAAAALELIPPRRAPPSPNLLGDHYTEHWPGLLDTKKNKGVSLFDSAITITNNDFTMFPPR